ncbi:glycosyl hydrolase family 8 [Clostridium cellulovorans]|uniref:Glycoside hydrolase family 8 n=2 Tax=Clostridium cellulovorans TaxID=1493 RepID=D9SUM5_CLOC7|nr:glycosyl hydrolase family 8 [Clostridium cellulovorans]ADL50930.1 glycoside hydrolase family 8 [Clostridium cellulovorans 743B]
MKKIGATLAIASIAVSSISSISAYAADTATNGAYYTNTYRNLFVESGKTQAQVDEKINKMFNQYFYGNDDQRIYYPVGTDMGYIKDIGNNDVRTEAMSYGMMIAVQLDKKDEFDRIWKWARTYMYHPDGQFKGYFAWQCDTNGKILDNTPAPDGEEYFVMSLLFAANRWGNGSGIFNYKAEAQGIMDAMLHQADDGVGVNFFNSTNNQIVFCPIPDVATFTDPSYHLPAFYDLWALWADKDNDRWATIAKTSREFFKKTVHPTTGLSPEYANFDGSPKEVSWISGRGNYSYDAWRTIANSSVDYAWWGKDPWQQTFANNLQNFFYSQGLSSYVDKYTVSGTKVGVDHSVGVVAMNAVGSLAATNSHATEFVNELWNTYAPTGTWRYFNGSLYLLGLLECSGNFKIWKPQQVKPIPLAGDVNGDGKVNAIDLAVLKSHLLGNNVAINKDNANLNGDSAINAIDLALLKKKILG